MSLYHFLYDNPYYLIFHNSLQSAVTLSLRSENAWHAAQEFGGYNMVLATFLAFVGSTLGVSMIFGVGWYISRWRGELPSFSEKMFQRIATIFRERLFIIMIIPPVGFLMMMPLLPLYVVLNGMFRVPASRGIAVIAVSRALYYAYYLLF